MICEVYNGILVICAELWLYVRNPGYMCDALVKYAKEMQYNSLTRVFLAHDDTSNIES